MRCVGARKLTSQHFLQLESCTAMRFRWDTRPLAPLLRLHGVVSGQPKAELKTMVRFAVAARTLLTALVG